MKQIENPEINLINEWKKYIGKYIYWQNKKVKQYYGFMLVYDVRLLGRREDKATLLYIHISSDGKEQKLKCGINKFDWDNNSFNLISKKEFKKLSILNKLSRGG